MKHDVGIFIHITLNISMNFYSLAIFTLLILPIQEHVQCLHSLMYSASPFPSILRFSLERYVSWVRDIPKYLLCLELLWMGGVPFLRLHSWCQVKVTFSLPFPFLTLILCSAALLQVFMISIWPCNFTPGHILKCTKPAIGCLYMHVYFCVIHYSKDLESASFSISRVKDSEGLV